MTKQNYKIGTTHCFAVVTIMYDNDKYATYLPSYNVARKRTINQLTNRRLPSPITKVTFCCIVAFKNKTILALEQSSSSMFSVRNLHNHKEKNKINIAAQNNLIFIHQKIVLKLAKYLPWKALEELK